MTEEEAYVRVFERVDEEAVYFPHFKYARDDEKLTNAMRDHGLKAYAIYFMLLEVCAFYRDYMCPEEEVLKWFEEFDCSTEEVNAIIDNYGLFKREEIDGEAKIYSKRQVSLLKKRDERLMEYASHFVG